MKIPDINDTPVKWPQFDPEAPDKYPIHKCSECVPINGRHADYCAQGYADEQKHNDLDDKHGVT